MPLEVVSNAFPINASTEPEANEEIGFEEIQKQMGIMLINVTKERRNYYHLQSELYDKAYKVQVEKHVATFRGKGPLVNIAAKMLLQGAKICLLPVDEGTQKKMSAIIDTGDHLVNGINQVFDNSVAANRTEASSHSEQLRSMAEQKRHEHQKYLSEEAEAMRKFEQQRNKQDDFMLSMAKGG